MDIRGSNLTETFISATVLGISHGALSDKDSAKVTKALRKINDGNQDEGDDIPQWENRRLRK